MSPPPLTKVLMLVILDLSSKYLCCCVWNMELCGNRQKRIVYNIKTTQFLVNRCDFIYSFTLKRWQRTGELHVELGVSPQLGDIEMAP